MNVVATEPPPDEELLTLALDLAIRLRDGEDREQVCRSLMSLRISDLRALVVCLAACIDPGMPMSALLAWNGGAIPKAAPPEPRARRPLAPCGTESAYLRHRSRGEDCQECREAMRPRWRYRRSRRGLGGRYRGAA